jgi:hypothetical protein
MTDRFEQLRTILVDQILPEVTAETDTTVVRNAVLGAILLVAKNAPPKRRFVRLLHHDIDPAAVVSLHSFHSPLNWHCTAIRMVGGARFEVDMPVEEVEAALGIEVESA